MKTYTHIHSDAASCQNKIKTMMMTMFDSLTLMMMRMKSWPKYFLNSWATLPPTIQPYHGSRFNLQNSIFLFCSNYSNDSFNF